MDGVKQKKMSLMQRIMGVSLAAVSCCTPQPEFEEVKLPPNQFLVPLFVVSSPPEELGPDCENEAVLCSHYPDYGVVLAFKCENSPQKTRISVSEKNIFGEKLWYHSLLSQNVSNQTFSEYCKSTFDNYIQFRKETE